MTSQPAPPRSQLPAVERRSAAVAGAVGAAVGLGAAEAVAGVVGPAPSLVTAVGNAVIAGVPAPVKDLAVALFGTGDKLALLIGTVVVATAVGAWLGAAGRRHPLVARGGSVVFALLGVAATLVSPLDSTLFALLPATAGVIFGVAVLERLMRLAPRDPLEALQRDEGRRRRRDFLRTAFVVTALGAVGGWLGRGLGAQRAASVERAAVELPAVDVPAPDVPAGARVAPVEDVTPLFTPNTAFYRIDTALMVPSVEVASWSLAITGMVEREVELRYDELLALAQVEADITIACVSNEVGGDLIDNARWQGPRLADVLDLAGVLPQATQVVGRAVDGWTAGFPTALAFDGRAALVALGMNGEPLPLEHGYPARLVVPGLYGYVSATKWLAELELTTLEAFDAYWIPRGWAKLGPIKTQSRIDVPTASSVRAGTVVLGGVAWAQHRGVERVEVRVDEGPWQEADLADALSADTWRQWTYAWPATPGRHTVAVRATDADGSIQTGQRTTVAPDGATGHHTRTFLVS